MAEYDWFDRSPTPWEIEAAELRPLGFQAIFEYGSTSRVKGIKFYLCRRGCGCVVWSPEIHMENVCPEFNPVVGNG